MADVVARGPEVVQMEKQDAPTLTAGTTSVIRSRALEKTQEEGEAA